MPSDPAPSRTRRPARVAGLASGRFATLPFPATRPCGAKLPFGAALLLGAALVVGCGGDTSAGAGAPTGTGSSAQSAAFDSELTPISGEGPLVSFLGDSITAGLHLPADEAFPNVLAERLAASGQPIRFVNAGVSWDTTAGGLRRLEWQLQQGPDIVVVELGANDAMRGRDLQSIEQDLGAIVRVAKESGALVLLLGMEIPPNYGPDYTRGFVELYDRIAEAQDVLLIPTFMSHIAVQPGMMLPDGLHPTATGQQALADAVMPGLVELLALLESDAD